MPKTEWKGATLLAPVPPALVSCGTLEVPNALAIAWTGILNSQPPKTYISVRPERYSHGLIKASGEFIINLPTAALVRAVDYCGRKKRPQRKQAGGRPPHARGRARLCRARHCRKPALPGLPCDGHCAAWHARHVSGGHYQRAGGRRTD